VGQAVDIVYLYFSKGHWYGFPQPSSREADESQSRQVVFVVGGEWADRPHPEGGGKYLLFKLVTCHKWSFPGIDSGPNAV